MPVVLLYVFASSAGLQADPTLLGVCISDDVAAQSRARVLIALRKVGLRAREDCATPDLRVGATSIGLEGRRGGERVAVSADAVGYGLLAEWVVAGPAADAIAPLGGPIEVRVRTEPPPAEEPADIIGVLGLGAAYMFDIGPNAHRGTLHLRGGIELFDGRLLLALCAGWMPGHPGGVDDFDWTVEAAEVGAALGGGLWWGPVRLALAAEFGWMRKFVHVAIPTRVASTDRTFDTAFIGGEVECALAVGAHWRVAVLVGARGYLGGNDYHWGDRELSLAPSAAALAGLRVWGRFP